MAITVRTDMVIKSVKATGNSVRPLRIAFNAALVALGALSHSVAAEPWRVEPDISLKATYTDNVDRGSGDEKRSDIVFNVAPGIRVSGRGPRLGGDASLRLNNSFHMDRGSDNNTTVVANGNARLEVIDDFFFIDGSVGANRQAISLFGPSSSSDYNTDRNSAQVLTATVTPSLKWRFSDATVGQARYTLSYTDSGNQALEGQTTHSWAAGLSNGTAFGRLGWALNASASESTAGFVGENNERSYRGTLSYAYGPTLNLRVFAGQEWNTYGDQEYDSPNYGGGFNWTPSQRTLLAAEASKRFFGTGYNVRLSHRMRRSALELTYVRDVTRTGRLYDPVHQLLVLLANSTTDPQARAAFENQIADYVANHLRLTHVSNAYTLDETLGLALSVAGVRNSLRFSLTRAEREAIEGFGNIYTGDFEIFDQTTETTASLTWGLRLTPRSNLTTVLARRSAKGVQPNGSSIDRNTSELSVGLDTRIGARSTGGLTYRHVRSTGTADYRENAISASFVHRF